MGSAPIRRPAPGICFPSSSTSGCHGTFYPTGENEQIFQIYFTEPTERPETWKVMNDTEGSVVCKELAERLERDGWAPEFTEPIRQARNVVRVGLRARDPISIWHKGRVFLLGDACHPPYVLICASLLAPTKTTCT
jgi:salicylate hydroxylase